MKSHSARIKGVQPDDRILREPECQLITGLSKSSRWRLEQLGLFPRRRRIARQSVGWLESELDAWISEQAAASDTMPQPAPLKDAAERRREPARAVR